MKLRSNDNYYITFVSGISFVWLGFYDRACRNNNKCSSRILMVAIFYFRIEFNFSLYYSQYFLTTNQYKNCNINQNLIKDECGRTLQQLGIIVYVTISYDNHQSGLSKQPQKLMCSLFKAQATHVQYINCLFSEV